MCLRLIRLFFFFSFFRPLFSNFYHQGVGGSSALPDIMIASFFPVLPSHFRTMRGDRWVFKVFDDYEIASE